MTTYGYSTWSYDHIQVYYMIIWHADPAGVGGCQVGVQWVTDAHRGLKDAYPASHGAVNRQC